MNVLQQVRGPINALLLSLLVACSEPADGYPPVARIGVTPRAIPETDAFRTRVMLDASASADPIDDPDRTHGLYYRWEILGDEFRVEQGSMISAQLGLVFLGEHPATVRLTVTDEDGRSSSAQTQLQLTLRP